MCIPPPDARVLTQSSAAKGGGVRVILAVGREHIDAACCFNRAGMRRPSLFLPLPNEIAEYGTPRASVFIITAFLVARFRRAVDKKEKI